jgi:hypothetical protein
MIKQIVVFTFSETATPEQRQRVIDGLNRFPAIFPQIKAWSLGRNVSKRHDRYQYGFVAEFESERTLADYLAQPQHNSFVHDEFLPLIAYRSIVTLSGEL